MCIRFILLLTVAIIAVQGEISSETITSDAAKLAKQYQYYVDSLTGPTIKDREQTMCPWMLKCCPDQLAHFASLMTSNTFDKKCMASSGDKLTGSGSTTCKQATEKFSQFTERTYAVIDFTRVGFSAIKEWSALIEKTCLPKELQAFYCSPSRMETLKPCMEKILQSLARENEINYSGFIKKLDNEVSTFGAKYHESLVKNMQVFFYPYEIFFQ